MKGRITVKRTIGQFRWELSLSKNEGDPAKAVIRHGMEVSELLWAGPMIRRLAKDNHLFSQDSGAPWPKNVGAPYPDRSMVSTAYICLRDISDGQFYKVKLMPFLAVLPRYFPVAQDGGCDIGYGMDGFFSRAKPDGVEPVKQKEEGCGIISCMTDDEVFEFAKEYGKPVDVRVIDFEYWS